MKSMYRELETKIQEAYEQGVTVETAERLAAQFLVAQLKVSEALKTADLDSRMKKSGVKAIRAAIYLDTVQKSEGKKPTEAAIDATITSNDLVVGEQQALDTAEVGRDELSRYYDIFLNAHIFFRSVSRGKFE